MRKIWTLAGIVWLGTVAGIGAVHQTPTPRRVPTRIGTAERLVQGPDGTAIKYIDGRAQ